MPTLRRSGCGLSRRAVALAHGVRDAGHAVSFAVACANADVGADNIDGFPIELRRVPKSLPLHWSLQSAAKSRNARLLAAAFETPHDLFVSCQPDMVTAYGASHPNRPVIFVCGGTVLLHEVAERHSQANSSWPRRAMFALDRALKRRVERAAFHRADAVVFDSETTRARVVRDYGLAPQKCRAVIGGADLRLFRPATSEQRRAARDALGVPAGAPVVCWTGRMSPEKNVEVLVRAVAEMSVQATLLLAGDGPLTDSIHALSGRLSVAPRVRFLGRLDDVRPCLHAADLFVFPSRGESFGGSLVEAMACGLPCVGLRPDGRRVCNANVEIIEHGLSGWLVDADCSTALAAAMDRLLRDEDLCIALGTAARRRAERCFNWRAAQDEFVLVVENVFAESRKAPDRHRPLGSTSCVLQST